MIRSSGGCALLLGMSLCLSNACGDGGTGVASNPADPVGTYDLETVDGTPLPVPWMPGFGGAITSGLLELTAAPQWRMEFVVSDGVSSTSSVEVGSYERTGDSTFRLVDPCGAVTQNGCQVTSYAGRITVDTFSVDNGTRLFLYVKRVAE